MNLCYDSMTLPPYIASCKSDSFEGCSTHVTGGICLGTRATTSMRGDSRRFNRQRRILDDRHWNLVRGIGKKRRRKSLVSGHRLVMTGII